MLAHGWIWQGSEVMFFVSYTVLCVYIHGLSCNLWADFFCCLSPDLAVTDRLLYHTFLQYCRTLRMADVKKKKTEATPGKRLRQIEGNVESIFFVSSFYRWNQCGVSKTMNNLSSHLPDCFIIDGYGSRSLCFLKWISPPVFSFPEHCLCSTSHNLFKTLLVQPMTVSVWQEHQ